MRDVSKKYMPEDRFIPDREIAYNYTAAMQFAQQFEDNLRGILHTIDWAFVGLDESLSDSEARRFKVFERFIEKSTSGSLKQKMFEVGVKLPDKAWTHIDQAIRVRNILAHKYLLDLRFPAPNDEHYEAIIKELQGHAICLYQAMMITGTALETLEKTSNRHHEIWNEFLKELNLEQNNINKGLWKNKNNE